MDVLTLLLLATIIGVGLFTPNMQFISVIGGLLLFAYVYGARNDRSPPAPAGGVKVKPIIVQRRYKGPESIYPKFMTMQVNPKWDSRKWFEQATGAAGLFAGWAAHKGRPSRKANDNN